MKDDTGAQNTICQVQEYHLNQFPVYSHGQECRSKKGYAVDEEAAKQGWYTKHVLVSRCGVRKVR